MSDENPNVTRNGVDPQVRQDQFEAQITARFTILEKDLQKRMQHIEYLVMEYERRLLYLEERLVKLEVSEVTRREQEHLRNGRF